MACGGAQTPAENQAAANTEQAESDVEQREREVEYAEDDVEDAEEVETIINDHDADEIEEAAAITEAN